MQSSAERKTLVPFLRFRRGSAVSPGEKCQPSEKIRIHSSLRAFGIKADLARRRLERSNVAPPGQGGASGPAACPSVPLTVQHPKVQTQKGGLDSFFVPFLGHQLFLFMNFFGSARLSDHLNIYFIRLDSILFEFNKVFQ